MKWILLLSLSFALSLASAEVSKKNIAKEKGFSYSGILVQESTFDDVLKKFGETASQSDSENIFTRCYYTKKTFIEFTAPADKGDTAIISQINVGKKTDHPNIKNCAQTTVSLDTTHLMNGIGISTKKELVAKILGPAKEEKESTFKYIFDRENEHMTFEAQIDAKQKIVAFTVSKSTQP